MLHNRSCIFYIIFESYTKTVAVFCTTVGLFVINDFDDGVDEIQLGFTGVYFGTDVIVAAVR